MIYILINHYDQSIYNKNYSNMFCFNIWQKLKIVKIEKNYINLYFIKIYNIFFLSLYNF